MVSVCLSSSPSHPALHAHLDQEAGSPGRTHSLGLPPRQHVCLPQSDHERLQWWSTPSLSVPGLRGG